MSFNHVEVTETIIKAFYTVYNALGYGFLEKVYQNAMVIELRKLGLEVKPEAAATVYYDGEIVGEHFIDLLVADCVIVELKAVKVLLTEHEAQLLNYLKATLMKLVYCSTSVPRLKLNGKHLIIRARDLCGSFKNRWSKTDSQICVHLRLSASYKPNHYTVGRIKLIQCIVHGFIDLLYLPLWRLSS